MSYIVMIKYSGKTFMTVVKASSRKSAKTLGVSMATGTISLGIFGHSPILLPVTKMYKSYMHPTSHSYILKRAKAIGAVVSATPCPGATFLPKPGFVVM